MALFRFKTAAAGFRSDAQTIEPVKNKPELADVIFPERDNLGTGKLRVEVPIAALAEFTDAVMATRRQTKPLDLSPAGQAQMRQSYTSGFVIFQNFIDEHTL